jgi:hypothetical protein
MLFHLLLPNPSRDKSTRRLGDGSLSLHENLLNLPAKVLLLPVHRHGGLQALAEAVTLARQFLAISFDCPRERGGDRGNGRFWGWLWLDRCCFGHKYILDDYYIPVNTRRGGILPL